MYKNLTQQEIAQILNGKLHQPTSQLINSACINAGQSQPGRVFFALAGSRSHGHSFVQQAQANKASLAVVEEIQPSNLAQIQVANSQAALTQLAAYNRSLFTQPVIGITGNSGKTTVKEILAALLEAHCKNKTAAPVIASPNKQRTKQSFAQGQGECSFCQEQKTAPSYSNKPIKLTQVLATQGNLNNHLGVPLTLLRLQPQHQAAVVELGANHLGEINELAQLAKPQLAVITNVTSAHLGEFGSKEKIAQAKGELIQYLPENGLLVLNADDEFFPYWQGLAEKQTGLKVLTFDLEKPADVYATNIQLNPQGRSTFTLHSPWGQQDFTSQLLGKHNLANALAAISLAGHLGMPLALQAQVLAQLKPAEGRLSVLNLGKLGWVLNDTYNASPGAVKAAIEVLAGFSGKKLLALGNLAELGEQTAVIHTELGQYAQLKQLDAVFSLKGPAELASQAFLQANNNLAPAAGFSAASPQALAQLLAKELTPTSCLLVKGSRSARMELLIQQLMQLAE